MDSRNTLAMQALIDTHEEPFVVIDRHYRIVAVNRAYEKAYGYSRGGIVGRQCFETHHRDRPCFQFGEDCPHQQVMAGVERVDCTHTHFDSHDRPHRVRIKAYPLLDAGGEFYLGEVMQEVTTQLDFAKQPVRMVGESHAFRRILEQLRLAASADSPVLLQGETGTGKDLAARFIHQHSRRREGNFLTLDCTVLTESLFEAEVFGHERGAFTGSVGAKQGLFELADGGTLFLDEIGEIPLHLQAKLLRVLETGEYRRIGGRKTRHANARVICATNRNLGVGIASKSFREDLYYRIACLHIQIPSLRERLQDVPLLANALIAGITGPLGRPLRITDGALSELQSYRYPGNVRELRNILNVAAAQCPSGEIDADDIARVISAMQARRRADRDDDAPAAGSGAAGANGQDSASLAELESAYLAARRRQDLADRLPETASDAGASAASPPAGSLDELESQYITALLQRKHRSRRELAMALGVSERTLYRKLKRYGLN